MLYFLLGIFAGGLLEWVAHKYLLHNFSYRLFSHSHFSIHHKSCRKNDFYDSDYEKFPPTSMNSGLTEIILLLSAVALSSPLALFSIWLWVGLIFHANVYYYVHRKSHIDVSWGKKWVPWHYDHHMGRDQNSNWGVTNSIFDHIFRTRVKSKKS